MIIKKVYRYRGDKKISFITAFSDKFSRRGKRGERGQGVVEYALLLVFMGLLVFSAVILIGNKTSNAISETNSAFGGSAPSGSSSPCSTIPVIDSISELSGAVGSRVTLTGCNLTAVDKLHVGSNTTVVVGGTAPNGSNWDFAGHGWVISGTELGLDVPGSLGLGSVSITAHNSNGWSSTFAQFTVTSPTVALANALCGNACGLSGGEPVESGTGISIFGTGLTDAASVKIGSVVIESPFPDYIPCLWGSSPCHDGVGSGMLDVTIPQSLTNGSHAVTVTTPEATVSAGTITIDNLRVDSLSESSGPSGTLVTLSGTGFESAGVDNIALCADPQCGNVIALEGTNGNPSAGVDSDTSASVTIPLVDDANNPIPDGTYYIGVFSDSYSWYSTVAPEFDITG